MEFDALVNCTLWGKGQTFSNRGTLTACVSATVLLNPSITTKHTNMMALVAHFAPYIPNMTTNQQGSILGRLLTALDNVPTTHQH